jgi:predicted transcriptional regulator
LTLNQYGSVGIPVLSEPSGFLPSVFRRGPRGTVDVIADILFLCKSGRSKTGIMYQANLSYQMLKFYVWHMVALGLLEESEDLFRTTGKGAEFLAHYQILAETLAKLGKINSTIIQSAGRKGGHTLGR